MDIVKNNFDRALAVHSKHLLSDERMSYFSHMVEQASKAESVSVNAAGNVTVVYKLQAIQGMYNMHEMVHGGAYLAIIDYYAAITQAANPGLWAKFASRTPTDSELLELVLAAKGVSQRVDATYMRPGATDAVLTIEVTILARSKRTSYNQVKFFDEKGAFLVCGYSDRAALSAKL